MTAFRLSPEASQDLNEIYEYIAQDNVDAAERVREELLEAMRGLAEMPGKGHLSGWDASAGDRRRVAWQTKYPQDPTRTIKMPACRGLVSSFDSEGESTCTI